MIIYTCSNTGIEYAPVLPVPFFARAKMSLPESAMGILASWIGDGFSHPFSKIPINNSRFRQNSSNSLPRVSVTSYKRVMFKGTLLIRKNHLNILINFKQ